MQCPFCKENNKESVKAHIIPEAFFKEISTDGNILKQRELDTHPKKMPIGVYDNEIWCRSCEKNYGKWDDFAIQILLKTPLEKFVMLPYAYEFQTNEINDIKMFFISLLWRASASKKKLFHNVSIGEFAKQAKKLLESGYSGNLEDFSIIISYSGKDESIIASPVKIKYSGVSFYRFYLGRFIADIKVSSQPTPKELLPAVVGKNNILVVLRTKRDFSLVKSVSDIAGKQLLTKK